MKINVINLINKMDNDVKSIIEKQLTKFVKKINFIYNINIHNNKTCKLCNTQVTYKNWSSHLKPKKYEANDSNQIIKTRFYINAKQKKFYLQ